MNTNLIIICSMVLVTGVIPIYINLLCNTMELILITIYFNRNQQPIIHHNRSKYKFRYYLHGEWYGNTSKSLI